MAFMITDECINCGGCMEICENRAIYETEEKSEIDPSRCTECVGISQRQMCADVCSVNAPRPDPNYRETREELLEKWRKLHPGETPKTGYRQGNKPCRYLSPHRTEALGAREPSRQNNPRRGCRSIAQREVKRNAGCNSRITRTHEMGDGSTGDFRFSVETPHSLSP